MEPQTYLTCTFLPSRSPYDFALRTSYLPPSASHQHLIALVFIGTRARALKYLLGTSSTGMNERRNARRICSQRAQDESTRVFWCGVTVERSASRVSNSLQPHGADVPLSGPSKRESRNCSICLICDKQRHVCNMASSFQCAAGALEYKVSLSALLDQIASSIT